MKSVLSILLALVCALAVPAQAEREQRLAATAASLLHKHARSLESAGLDWQAAAVWYELIEEYARDHEAARNALGFRRVDDAWVLDPAHRPATAKASRGDARKWEKLARRLGKDHRALADAFAADREMGRARHHYRRALRFVPEDAAAAGALGLAAFAGVHGDPTELAVLRRSCLLEQAATFLAGADFPVEELPTSARHEMIERAGVVHRGVRSEHFEVWGDLSPATLADAARWAERSLRLCRLLYAHGNGFRDVPTVSAEIAFFREEATWRRVLESNRDLFEEGELRFLLDHSSAAYLQGASVLYAAAEGDLARVYDQAVRVVAIDLSRLHRTALRAGVGHAVVGMFFGRSLIDLVDRSGVPRASTVAARAPDRLVALPPELNIWAEVAREHAWARRDPSAAELPLIRPEVFGPSDRVEAWALCDYLLRRDPDLLRALDDASVGATSRATVAVSYRNYSPGALDLAEVEAAWRRFWTDGLAARVVAGVAAAGRDRSDKKIRGALRAINELRLKAKLLPIAWVPCTDRDRAAERMRASTVTSGSAGGPGTATVFVARLTDIEGWSELPGESALLWDPDLELVEAFDRSGALLLERLAVPPGK